VPARAEVSTVEDAETVALRGEAGALGLCAVHLAGCANPRRINVKRLFGLFRHAKRPARNRAAIAVSAAHATTRTRMPFPDLAS
jgi:hypothetical protein